MFKTHTAFFYEVYPVSIKSITYNQFPQIRFLNGQKLLWNPIVKEMFKPRPEERIRLQVVEFMHRRGAIPLTRMSSEKGLKVNTEKSGRTDLVVYDKSLTPYILIECKAPDVKITERAAIQIAQYNSKVNAQLLLLTNGEQDFLFREDGGFKPLNTAELIAQEDPIRDAQYWYQRGFAHKNSKIELVDFLNRLYNVENEHLYMDIPNVDKHPPLSHFYRLIPISKSKGLAVASILDDKGNTRLTGIVFENASPNSIVSVDLNSGITYYTNLDKPESPFVIKTTVSDINKIFKDDVAKIPNWFDELINRK
mgnify:CR=1 FL=1